MEDEVFTIYDDTGNKLGEDIRAHVHQYGYWHEVIHVWVYDPRETDPWIYVQQRSIHKKDYAGLYDITTAGHVDAKEPHKNAAIRECEEEIGLHLQKERLRYIGDIKEAVYLPDFKDKEIAHVYIYASEDPQFHIGEEVETMRKARKSAFLEFAKDKRNGLSLFSMDEKIQKHCTQGEFCHHASSYYQWILRNCDPQEERKSNGR